MNLWIMSLSHFLHVFGAVVWIGGIIMTIWIILPGAKTALGSAPMVGTLMKEIAQRFTRVVNISILVLIGTGVILINYDKNFTSFFDFDNRWNLVIFIKFILVVTMILIHFYRGLILNQKILKLSTTDNDTQVSRLKNFSLNLVKTNAVLGITVLVLAAVSISQ